MSKSIDMLLRPTSVAVVGIGSRPGSMAERTLVNLVEFGFRGVLIGVARGREEVAGQRCVPTIDDLPEGMDVAVLSVPRAGTIEAVMACARRGVKSVIIFSSGFAEESAEGRADQERIAAICEESGMLLAGPNCLGLINYVDGVPLCFGPLKPEPVAGRRAAAIISQSGAMMANAMVALHARGLAVSYAISTGNEAGMSTVDYITSLAADPAADVLCIFAEQIRRPAEFIEAARAASRAGKRIVLLHPGRSAEAREAALSHTGTLAGDYDVMAAVLKYEDVEHVETLEELIDVAELLIRYPRIQRGRVAILTDSGAAKGLMLDYCNRLGLDLATLSETTIARLGEILPGFAVATNPLDATAAVLRDDALLGNLAEAILADDAVSALLVTTMPDPIEFPLTKAERTAAAMQKSGKAAIYAVIGGEAAINPGLEPAIRAAGGMFSRSPERALRALGTVQSRPSADAFRAVNPATPAVQAHRLSIEADAKALLQELGIAVPRGGLARTLDEAQALAADIGFPVVLKVQSSDILHKTDVGGVAVGLAGPERLAAAWADMTGRIEASKPDARISGYLVEGMAVPGAEFVIGAKRDENWGPIVMAGLGGVWLEVMKDRRLFPATLAPAAIRVELGRLRAAPMFAGLRGQPALDIDAVVAAIVAVADFMIANPGVSEFEINPLTVYPKGEGVVALDALAVASKHNADIRQ